MPTALQRPRKQTQLYHRSRLQYFIYELLHYNRDKGIFQLFDYKIILSVLLSTLLHKLYGSVDIFNRIRQLYEGRAVFRSPDETIKWILHYLTNGPPSRNLPRDIEVTAVPLMKMKATVPKKAAAQSNPMEEKSAQEGTDSKGGHEENTRIVTKAQKIVVPMSYKAAPQATIKFVFEGTKFWAKRELSVHSNGKVHESVSLTYWSRSSAPLDRLIIEAQQLYMAYTQKKAVKKVPKYRLDKYGQWQGPTYGDKRRLDTLFLPSRLKQDIAKDARTFFSPKERQRYASRSIPYRRGYLLWGPPGTGKSTLAYVLASEYCESLYILDLGSAHIDDDKFLHAMSSLPPRCLLLIEDVDATFVKRDAWSLSRGGASDDLGERQIVTDAGIKKPGISLSSLLNSLDGHFAPEERLLIMTTNHPDHLDDALIRNGRIDRKFHIKNAASEQISEVFIQWYTLRGAPSDNVRMLAEVFTKLVPSEAFPMAAIQNYLLAHDADPQEAVEGVEAWVKEESKVTRVA